MKNAILKANKVWLSMVSVTNKADQEIHLDIGQNVVIESGLTISLKVGANAIEISPSGIKLIGKVDFASSGGAASGSGYAGSDASPPEAITRIIANLPNALAENLPIDPQILKDVRRLIFWPNTL